MSTNVSAAPQLNLHLRVNLLSSPTLVRDYHDGASALAPFFAGFPWDLDAYKRIAAGVRAQFTPETLRDMAAAITATSDAAQHKLDAVVRGDGFFVSTGQQAGLFSGPLFTVYKTLTTIKLAEALERELGVTIAPLFWTAADDHDFAEVNHAFVLGTDNEVKRVEIAGEGAVQASMNRLSLQDDVSAAIESVSAVLPDNEFAQQTIAWLRECYVPGRSVAEAFSLLMQRLFASRDLLVTSSAHPVVKRLAVPIVATELERSEAHERAVRRQTDKLIAAGYHEQVTVRAGAANVLYEDENGRDRLVHEDGAWQLSRSKRVFTAGEIGALLASDPERFSPNVHLRPVVASAIFPTLAYIGGPAEVSYFAQIGCLFESHGVVMPLVMPRVSIDVVEHKVQKVLDKFELDVYAFRQPIDQLVSQIMRDELPPEVTEVVARLQEQLGSGYQELLAAALRIDPTLKGPLENARNTSQKTLADAEKKIVSHLKKKNETGVEQLRKAALNLYPEGHPQERVISVISYLARYGPAFLDEVARHIELRLDAAAPDWRGVACG